MQKSCKRCTWLTWLMTCTKLEAFRKPRKNGLETCERAESVRKFGRVKVRSWAMLFRIWNVWSDASWTPGTCSRRIDTWCRSARASQVHRMWTWEHDLNMQHGTQKMLPEHWHVTWRVGTEHEVVMSRACRQGWAKYLSCKRRIRFFRVPFVGCHCWMLLGAMGDWVPFVGAMFGAFACCHGVPCAKTCDVLYYLPWFGVQEFAHHC